MFLTLKRAVLALLLVTGLSIAIPNPGLAAAPEARFEIIGQPIKAGKGVSFLLRAPQAEITHQKLHMVMGSMDMDAPVKALGKDDKGDYRFSADLTMYGEWTLDLVATVSGEKEPVHTSVKFQVEK